MLSVIKTFYSNLYKRKRLPQPRLTENERALCEEKLTKHESWEVLVSMGNNKGPVNGGFTKEFYLSLPFRCNT